MEDVRFYDFDFHLLHIEHDIFSCNWTLYDNDIGKFEMHFPIESELTSVMMEHRYLVAVQGDKQAIVTGRQLGKEGILYGRSCNWILTRFYVSEFFHTDELLAEGNISSCDAQRVCNYLVDSVFNGLVVVEENPAYEFSQVVLESKTVVPLFDLVQECMKQSGGGHRVLFDVEGKRWVFTVTKGRSLPIVFSEENRNAYDMAYTEDLQEFADVGWYMQKMENMGEWDADLNNPRLVNGDTDNFAKAYQVTEGATRFGIKFVKGDYIVCKNKEGIWEKANEPDEFPTKISSGLVGLYAWEAFLDGQTEKEAEKALETKRVQREVMCKMNGFSYGKDYALGDLVWTEIIKNTYRKSQIKKITGVRLWYEADDIGEEPMMEEVEG